MGKLFSKTTAFIMKSQTSLFLNTKILHKITYLMAIMA